MAAKPKLAVVPVIKTGSNIISIQDTLKAQAALMGDRTAPATGSAIRITQDKHFILPNGLKTPGPIELVVVDFTVEHRYYESKFDPKVIVPPNCFAIGTNPLKMVPSKNAPEIQAADCQICPMNAFGSDGDGKACKNSRVLAVLPPDAGEDTPLWKLSVSATALKGFDAFVSYGASVLEMPPVGMVVSVGFDPNRTYSSLVFSNPQPNPNVGVHFARQAEATKMLTVEPDVSKFVAKPAARGKVAARR